MKVFWPNHIFSAVGLLIWKWFCGNHRDFYSVYSYFSLVAGRLSEDVGVWVPLGSLAAIQVSASLALLSWGTLRMQRKNRWMVVTKSGDGFGWSKSIARSAEWRRRPWLYCCWWVLSMSFFLFSDSVPKIWCLIMLMMNNDEQWLWILINSKWWWRWMKMNDKGGWYMITDPIDSRRFPAVDDHPQFFAAAIRLRSLPMARRKGGSWPWVCLKQWLRRRSLEMSSVSMQPSVHLKKEVNGQKPQVCWSRCHFRGCRVMWSVGARRWVAARISSGKEHWSCFRPCL